MNRRYFVNVAAQAGIALSFSNQLKAFNLKKVRSVGVLLGQCRKTHD